MSAINSILVPVDFSSVAANAYDFALRLADKYPARIDLLYFIPPALSAPGSNRFIVDSTNKFKVEAEENMSAFRQRGIDAAIKDLTGIPEVCSFIEAGNLEPTVKQRIEAGHVDLIVMGTIGQEKPLSNLVGTNTTFLIDEVLVPVLIVPNEASYRPPSRLCYATDLQHLDPFRITELFDLFAPFAPVVDFVHVAASEREQTEYDLSLLRKVVDRPDVHDRLNFTRLVGKDEVEVLLRYAETSNADIVVMNRPHRGWLERLWNRSHTREAALKTEVPLLFYMRRIWQIIRRPLAQGKDKLPLNHNLMMDNQSPPEVSTIENVLSKMKTSIGPVTKVLHRNDYSKVVVLGLNADVLFPDHSTEVPAKLTVLKGSVVYRDAEGNTPLFQYDELEIPMNVMHSVRAIRSSVCLLTMG